MSARDDYPPDTVSGGHHLLTMVTLPHERWERMCAEIDRLRRVEKRRRRWWRR